MIYYLGIFPPPFGGVTKKNDILYEYLSKKIELTKFDLNCVKTSKIKQGLHLIKVCLFRNNKFIVGISDRRGLFRLFSCFLFILNKNAMQKSIALIMGGEFPNYLINDKKSCKYIKQYKRIYVETKGMCKKLNELGINNVGVFPNCREKPKNILIRKNNNKEIKCLYLSQISKEKGADIVLRAAEILNNNGNDFMIDFYGHIENTYISEFYKEVKAIENVNYKGVFKNDVYELISDYDVMLFPSKWKIEGVPGTIIEAFISGVPIIVSNVSYNAEIVTDMVNGIVMDENNEENLVKSIEYLRDNEDKLIEMKKAAAQESKKYIIDNYVPLIINDVMRT